VAYTEYSPSPTARIGVVIPGARAGDGRDLQVIELIRVRRPRRRRDEEFDADTRLDLRREFVAEAAEQAWRERERQLVLGAGDDFFEVPEDRRPRFHQRHRLGLAGRCGVAGLQLVDHLRERRPEVTERVVRIDGDDLHRPRFAELDEPSVRKAPNGVVHAGLRDIGSVGDVARRQLTVFQHGEVRVDLVLAEVEAVPDAIERAAEGRS